MPRGSEGASLGVPKVSPKVLENHGKLKDISKLSGDDLSDNH
jgi:hypothetical protein